MIDVKSPSPVTMPSSNSLPPLQLSSSPSSYVITNTNYVPELAAKWIVSELMKKVENVIGYKSTGSAAATATIFNEKKVALLNGLFSRKDGNIPKNCDDSVVKEYLVDRFTGKSLAYDGLTRLKLPTLRILANEIFGYCYDQKYLPIKRGHMRCTEIDEEFQVYNDVVKRKLDRYQYSKKTELIYQITSCFYTIDYKAKIEQPVLPIDPNAIQGKFVCIWDYDMNLRHGRPVVTNYRLMNLLLQHHKKRKENEAEWKKEREAREKEQAEWKKEHEAREKERQLQRMHRKVLVTATSLANVGGNNSSGSTGSGDMNQKKRPYVSDKNDDLAMSTPAVLPVV